MKRINRNIQKRLAKIKRYFEVKEEERIYKSRNATSNYQITSHKYMLNDKYDTHPFDAHYIYHPSWAIKILKEINPKKHIDISSIMYFATMASAFINVDYYDYRALHINLPNLRCKNADLTKLPFEDSSIESISCMHTVEHIGLGRYGDTIDPDGDKKAISELQRVTKSKGDILFVVPVGKPKVVFNAHRVYKYFDIIKLFNSCGLKKFSVILDNPKDGLLDNVPEKVINQQNYACGCFWFKKN